MDDSTRRNRQQNELPMHPGTNPRYQPLQDPSQQQQQQHHQQQQQQQQQQHRRSYAASHREGFRPAPLNTASSSAGGQRMGGSASYSGGYYQDTFTTPGVPQSTMGYHQPPAEYGQADRQTQSFATNAYNPTMMYNVQPAAGTQNAGVYDTGQGFAQRQPAGLQLMAADVTAPYFPSEHSTAAASGMQTQTPPSGSSQPVYQQAGLPSYPAGTMAATIEGAIASQTTAAADVSMDDEYSATGGLDEAYASYQTALKEIFQNISNGVLSTASESLLNVSDWLLSHVSELGLTSDDQNLHSDRIKLWNDFNHAWLALFQRQKELMEAGQQLQHPRNLVTQEGLEKMGRDLVRLCDAIEPHGLVDYQYGVWEEQIIAILEECLDLYEPSGEASGNITSSISRRR